MVLRRVSISHLIRLLLPDRTLVRQLPNPHPHHYCVQIASKGEAASGAAASKPVMIATRSMTMTPNDSKNLDMFLAEYKRHGDFQLLPAALPSAGSTQPTFFFDLGIRKKLLTAKPAAEVSEHDIESLALRQRGLKFGS